MRRTLLLLALEVVGVAAVVAGVALVYVPAAFIVGGAAVTLMVERQTAERPA